MTQECLRLDVLKRRHKVQVYTLCNNKPNLLQAVGAMNWAIKQLIKLDPNRIRQSIKNLFNVES
jgi:hypothetical protein